MFDDHEAALVASIGQPDAVLVLEGLQLLGRERLLDGENVLGSLFVVLFVALTAHLIVGVAHERDEHVEEHDVHNEDEDDEDQLAKRAVVHLVELGYASLFESNDVAY